MARQQSTYLRNQIRAGMPVVTARTMIRAAHSEGLISMGEKRALETFLTKQVRKRKQVEDAKPERKITLGGGTHRLLFDEETIREAQRLAKEDNDG